MGDPRAERTRKGHEKWELFFNAHAQEEAIGLLQAKKDTGVKWSTVDREVGAAMGALKRMELKPSRPFKDFATVVQRNMFRETVEFPVSLTKRQIQAAWEQLELDGRNTEANFLWLLWITSMRPSELMTVMADDVVQDAQSDSLSILIRDGKGVKARGSPYVIHTRTGQMRNRIAKFLASRSHQNLFEQKEKIYCVVRQALRRQHPQALLRSLRRSTLEQMAEAQVQPDTLRLFSNHASTTMLNRYLAWGLHNGFQRNAMHKAVQYLL